MRRRPQEETKVTIGKTSFSDPAHRETGLILSGGGVRAAYQAGAIRALSKAIPNEMKSISIVLGSSIGAVNGLVFASCLKENVEKSIEILEELWRERNFRNTFNGSPTRAFVRAIRIATSQYLSPGPNKSNTSVFDPTPLRDRLDAVIASHGGLTPENRCPALKAVGVMTTIEGAQRKPLLFLSSHQQVAPEEMKGASFDICYVNELSAKHGFASAALPSILPPVELDTEHGKVQLVDGGISQNVPVDPAVRLGAERIIIVDISGRSWWLDRYGEAHDSRPSWEIPAGADTFCLRPPQTLTIRCKGALGPILKQAVGNSTKRFMAAVGPIWPLFTLVKNKLGEDVAYEVMSYAALDPEYLNGLIETGYHETLSLLRQRAHREFLVDEEETLQRQAL